MRSKIATVFLLLVLFGAINRLLHASTWQLYEDYASGSPKWDVLTLTVNLPVGEPINLPDGNYTYSVYETLGGQGWDALYVAVSGGIITNIADNIYPSVSSITFTCSYYNNASLSGNFTPVVLMDGAVAAWFSDPVSFIIEPFPVYPGTPGAAHAYNETVDLHFGNIPDQYAYTPDDPECICNGVDSDDSGVQNGVDTDENPDSMVGMPKYNINSLQTALTISDNPLGYKLPIGSRMRFIATYNQNDTSELDFHEVGIGSLFTYSCLGPNWTLNWISYVVDDPTSVGNTAYTYIRGGGIEVYSGTTYNSSTGYYGIDPQSCAELQYTGTGSTASYVRYLPDGSTQLFSESDGATQYPRHIFLTSVTDPQGNTTNIFYDTSQRITTIQDALGQDTDFLYGNSTYPYNITQITDPLGRNTQFQYDSNSRLTQITDAEGMSSQFSYTDGNTFINSMTTPYGTTDFDDTPTVDGGRSLVITDPLGGQEQAVYMDGLCADSDPSGSVPAGVTNSGLSGGDSYFWNYAAMATSSTNVGIAEVTHWLLAPDGVTAMPIPSSRKDALENRVWYLYPGQSGTNTTTEGSLAMPSEILRVLDSGSTQEFQYLYNSTGHVTNYTDPLGRTTNYAYASNGVDLTQVSQVDGAGSDILVTATYNGFHRPLQITDASGQSTGFTYNGYGERTTLTDPLSELTTWNYDASGYLRSVVGAIPSATGTFTYDSAGRLFTATGPAILSDPTGYTLTFYYDNLDRLTEIGYPDNTSTIFNYNRLDVGTVVDRLGRTTSYSYDDLDHLVSVTDPAGRETQFSWCDCGALDSITGPNGNTTTFDRDVEERTTSKTYADNSTVYYTYENTTSRLKAITDAKEQVTNLSYYNDNDPDQITYTGTNGGALSPSTHTVTYTYDSVYNRLTGMADATGATTYSYNAITSSPALGAGRLASIAGPLANSTIAFGYDQLGRVNSRTINGGANSVSFAFDALGRTGTAGNPLGTFVYTPIGGSNLISNIAYPNGQSVALSYLNNVGDHRLQEIKNLSAGSSVISQFDYAYDAASRILQWTKTNPSLSGSETYNFSYDGSDEMTAALLSSTAGTVSSYGYAYDGAENRTSNQTNMNLATTGVNDLNQFTTVSGGGSMTFQGTLEDPATVTIDGNPATVNSSFVFTGTAAVTTGTNTVTISATDPFNQTTTQQYQVTVPAASGTFSYDANGNLTSDGVKTYEWDAANRLTAVNEPGDLRSEFSYDGFGRRAMIVETSSGVATGTTNFVWSGTEICEARDGNDNVLKRYYPQGVQISGTSYYYTRDHLGSIRELTGTNGTVLARYDYDPYGQQTEITGTMAADFGYTGYYVHQPSGLDLAWGRGYSASEGRWISRDPIGEAGGINLYGYVLNNPISGVDPLGLFDPGYLSKSLELAGEEEVAGGGPEDPVADVAAIGTAIVGGALTLFMPGDSPQPQVQPATSGAGGSDGGNCQKMAPPGFPGDDSQNHHWFPQQFEPFFDSKGIDIDDPMYTEQMPMQWHIGEDISLHSQGYNAAWGAYIQTEGATATTEDIINQMYLFKSLYGY